MSTAFENAIAFVKALDGYQGWDGCKQYVADGATFFAKVRILREEGIDSIEKYCNWLALIGKTYFDSSYEIKGMSFANNTAIIYAAFTGKQIEVYNKNSPSSNQYISTDYVYIITMEEKQDENHDPKIIIFRKLWNDCEWQYDLGWQ